MSGQRCLMTSRVDRHFARQLEPAGERAMREHLPTCADCRARYDNHLLLESLDPEAAGPQARIAAGLGIGGARTALRVAAPFMGALALAAAVLFLVTRPSGAGSPLDTGFGGPGFAARGGDASAANDSPYVIVHRAGSDGGPSRAGASIRRGDELSFAYGNASNKRFLMIYGVDEHRHVFWYYPAWSDPKEDPHSIAIVPGAQSLPDAIRHDLDGDQLEIHAVFTDVPLGVKAVEGFISGAPLGKTPNFGPGSIDRTIRFEVDP